MGIFKTSNGTCSEDCSGERITWKKLSLTGAGDLPATGNYYLTTDVTLGRELVLEDAGEAQALRIDLNGHTLTNPNGGIVRLNGENLTLVLTDTAGGGKLSTGKTGALVRLTAGVFNHFGGCIEGLQDATGQKAPENGGAVLVEGGEYLLDGGSVKGGKAGFGGAVAVTGTGAFTIRDGMVSGGVAETAGGNIALLSSQARFAMHGGLVEGGSNKDHLGSNMFVTSGGWFYMTGGEFRGGQDESGSNLFINGSSSADIDGTARFTGAENCIYLVGSTLNIRNGSFESKIEYNSGDFKVYGGTFNQDVSAWVAEDSTIVRDGKGVYTVNTTCVAMVGKVGYALLADAVFAAIKNGGTITMVADYTDEDPLVIPGNVRLDLNGFDLNCDVQVDFDKTLWVFDNKTDNYTVTAGEDRNYGMIHGKITGNLALDHELPGRDEPYRYLTVEHKNAGYSFHRISLEVRAVQLVGDSSAMSIETVFRGDEVVTDWVDSYGMSVQSGEKNPVLMDHGKPTPGTENSKIYKTGEILSLAGSVEANNTAAQVEYSSYAYLNTANGTVKSTMVTRSFLQVVAQTNRALAAGTLTQTQKDGLSKLYRTYREAVSAWDGQMEYIRNYATKLYRVGYAVVNIDPTPDMYGKVGLLGYDNHNTTRKVTGVDPEAPLLAICLAVTDYRGETVVLVSVDSAAVGGDVAARIMQEASRRMDIPVGHVMLNSNHQHSTPNFTSVYDDYFVQQVVKGIELAMNDRKIVLGMEAQSITVTRSKYNHVRNSQYLDKEGNPIPGAMSTPNHNDRNRADLAGIITGNVVRESQADNAVQVLRIVREGDSQAIVLVNFQGHPIMATSGSKTIATADAIGILRNALAEQMDCKPMYFTGASGNVQISGSSYYEWGRSLAAEITDCLEDAGWTSVIGDETGGVAAMTGTYHYRAMVNSAPSWLRVTNPAFANLSDAELVQKMLTRAEEIWGGSGYIGSYRSSDLNEYGLYSKYHAKHYSGRKDMKSGDTKILTISALSFGDVGFVVAPYEMYDTNGVEVRRDSPFAITFVTTMAGMPELESRSLSNGYIPSQLGYDNGGYSIDISRYAPGTGEDLCRDFVGMLRQMKNN